MSKSPWRALSLGSLITLDLTIFVVIGFLIGRQADEWTGLKPLWSIVGVLAGLAAGIFSVIPMIKRYIKDTGS